jgi:hypothetical protein
MEKQIKEIKISTLFIYLAFVLMGFLLGALFVYKIEINTINQALYSMNYCYETYYSYPTYNLDSYAPLKEINYSNRIYYDERGEIPKEINYSNRTYNEKEIVK